MTEPRSYLVVWSVDGQAYGTETIEALSPEHLQKQINESRFNDARIPDRVYRVQRVK